MRSSAESLTNYVVFLWVEFGHPLSNVWKFNTRYILETGLVLFFKLASSETKCYYYIIIYILVKGRVEISKKIQAILLAV